MGLKSEHFSKLPSGLVHYCTGILMMGCHTLDPEGWNTKGKGMELKVEKGVMKLNFF